MVLKIGPLAVDPPVVLAPMAGVTNTAFRRVCRRFGGGLFVSEMVSARALVERNPRTRAMVTFDPDEPVRSVQLYAVDPAVAHDAVRLLVDEHGAEHVDLNFGCPADKVTRRGGGAALPWHRSLFAAIVSGAVTAAAGVPVTVKLRIGIDGAHRTAVDAGRIAQDVGAAAVTLHARTAEQRYSGAADWNAIGELKEAVTHIPVIGNGDIWEPSDALAMRAATGCDGVAIGRGCLGRPWLFAGLAAVLADRPAPPVLRSLAEVADVMRVHARALADGAGETRALRDFRKHTGWYLTGFPIGGARRRAFAAVSTLAELDALLDEVLSAFGGALLPPPATARTARGHTTGARPVALPAGWLQDPLAVGPPGDDGTAVSGG